MLHGLTAAWAIVIGLILIVLAMLSLGQSARARRHSGLPAGQVLLSDMSGARRGRPLYSPRYRLTGTPDYIISTRDGPVPVEVKSGVAGSEPHESHLLQLLAYCLLIEEAEGRPPPYGLLIYSTGTFRVDYSPQMRARLLSVISEMRQATAQAEVSRNHDHKGKCRTCSYRSICDQSLWGAGRNRGPRSGGSIL